MLRLVFVSSLLVALTGLHCDAAGVQMLKTASLVDTLVTVVRDCGQFSGRSEDQVWACLKVKAIASVDMVVRDAVNQWQDRDIQITENVVLVKRDATLTPRSTTNQKSGLMELITQFLGSRTLEIRFPRNIAPKLANNIEEARGKLKKMGGTLLAGMLMMKGTMAAMALGGLALIAGKALTLSMLSLLLSIVSALKKASSGGSDHRRSGRRADHQVPNSDVSQSQWSEPMDADSYSLDATSQQMAYAGYKNYQ
ncbi:hypothetical protein B566_EDAN007899 [Ephemera danica]|nr:hypothetical protein B566_EDAN007899 [Ephemera danica]